jgi:YrhK-like protein
MLGHRVAERWAARPASWWIGLLFAIGSVCFLVGPFPGFVELVGSAADSLVFFVGSIFFTSAALLQYLEAANAVRGGRRMRLLTFQPRRIDWWATVVQLVGTVAFNVDTFRAMQTGFDNVSFDRLVWAPEAFGSACFLISGILAYIEVGGREHNLEWRIAAVNLLGCVLFGISAIAGYVVPRSGSVLDLAAANVTTALGAACFLIGALLLIRESAAASPAPSA